MTGESGKERGKREEAAVKTGERKREKGAAEGPKLRGKRQNSEEKKERPFGKSEGKNGQKGLILFKETSILEYSARKSESKFHFDCKKIEI